MKLAEIGLTVLALGAFLYFLQVPFGGGLLFILSWFLLASFFFGFGVLVFNNIGLQKLFEPKPFAGISTLQVVQAAMSGGAISLIVLGSLFKMMAWDGGSLFPYLVTGLGLLGIGSVLLFLSKNKASLSSWVRMGLFAILGVGMFILPADTWIEIKYQEHPAYLEMIKEIRQDPQNMELRARMDELQKELEKQEN